MALKSISLSVLLGSYKGVNLPSTQGAIEVWGNDAGMQHALLFANDSNHYNVATPNGMKKFAYTDDIPILTTTDTNTVSMSVLGKSVKSKVVLNPSIENSTEETSEGLFTQRFKIAENSKTLFSYDPLTGLSATDYLIGRPYLSTSKSISEFISTKNGDLFEGSKKVQSPDIVYIEDKVYQCLVENPQTESDFKLISSPLDQQAIRAMFASGRSNTYSPATGKRDVDISERNDNDISFHISDNRLFLSVKGITISGTGLPSRTLLEHLTKSEGDINAINAILTKFLMSFDENGNVMDSFQVLDNNLKFKQTKTITARVVNGNVLMSLNSKNIGKDGQVLKIQADGGLVWADDSSSVSVENGLQYNNLTNKYSWGGQLIRDVDLNTNGKIISFFGAAKQVVGGGNRNAGLPDSRVVAVDGYLQCLTAGKGLVFTASDGQCWKLDATPAGLPILDTHSAGDESNGGGQYSTNFSNQFNV
jgi:hypothetical protein